ncbi:hypothetical protein DPEC_G00278300 [Dallia pectoralis]|uniref:Uncharacterized protein n=1 Tax=Dallia pectoralis TaxID=75939 RepID=A0ACC2FMH0_DALPE|nr:hypothetical protein DPEC_G00278300 [Dallia pectoralis]
MDLSSSPGRCLAVQLRLCDQVFWLHHNPAAWRSGIGGLFPVRHPPVCICKRQQRQRLGSVALRGPSMREPSPNTPPTQTLNAQTKGTSAYTTLAK